MSNAITVSFNNQTITAFMHNESPVIAMKPICENMGVDWEAQRKRIQRHPVLNSSASMMTVVAEDGKNREMTCLPLSMLNGWLFGIDANRVKPEIKDKVIAYQRECFDVLAAHFGMVAKKLTIDTHQARAIQQAVNRLVKKTGKDYRTIYNELKTAFGVAKYNEVTPEQFPAVCKFLGITYEGEFIPRDDSPAIPDGKVMVDKSHLDNLISLVEMQRERFYLVEQAEEQIQYAFNTLSVMTSGQMKQANDAIRAARYRMHDTVTHAKALTCAIRSSMI